MKFRAHPVFLLLSFLFALICGGAAANPNSTEATSAEVAPENAQGSVEESERPTSHFADEVTVVSASRRVESLVDAPAAVAVVTAEEIARRATHGQVPKLLERLPGVELTQSGVYDFNLNVRGVNMFLNRRVLVLVDGRDTSMPFLGSQEWANFGTTLDTLEKAELIRGPSSALYGSSALNGVINLVTRSAGPNGGQVRATLGELSTQRLDLSHSGALGSSTFFRLQGSYMEGDDFVRSRVGSGEYPGVPLEVIPPPSDGVQVVLGSLRLDHTMALGGSEALLTFEAGSNRSDGAVMVTNSGRFQFTDSRRPWTRLSLSTPRWHLLAAHTERENPGLIQLNAGAGGVLDSSHSQLEVRSNATFAGGAGSLVGGAAYQRIAVDTRDDSGRQTYLAEKVTEDRLGIFGQLDYELSDRLKGVVAMRWDTSDLYDAELSPRAALVWSPAARHRLRLSWSQAYQAPNVAEFFTFVPVAPPLDLSGVEASLASQLGGVALGLGNVPLLGLGNQDLEVESVRSWELGYSATVGKRTFLTLDLYSSEFENFVSNLLPQVGTSLGRLNPNFGPYAPPAGLAPEVASEVIGALENALPNDLFAALSNAPDGRPVIALLSFTNVGQVETTGAELGVQVALSKELRLDASYSWFDFDIQEQPLENPIAANAPEHKASLGLTYVGERLDASLGWRYSDGFDWSGGLYVGAVPSYTVTDLTLGYRLGSDWTLGLDVSNIFDDEHYELFGGDLLGRRALFHVTHSW